MRQFSIADMTLSWARLRWPALAGTLRWAVSAEDIGDLERGAQAASAAGIVAFHQHAEMLERTRHRADRLGGDAGVERGRVQLGVPEQNLDARGRIVGDADLAAILPRSRP